MTFTNDGTYRKVVMPCGDIVYIKPGRVVIIKNGIVFYDSQADYEKLMEANERRKRMKEAK